LKYKLYIRSTTLVGFNKRTINFASI